MKIRYEAEDGKIFTTEKECLQHDYKTKVAALIMEIKKTIAVNLAFSGDIMETIYEVNEGKLYELITNFVKKEGSSTFIRRLRFEDDQKEKIRRMGL